jgi:hypothetical protein
MSGGRLGEKRDHGMTCESPCSPITNAGIEDSSSARIGERMLRRRLESSRVPLDITFC